jgi:peptidoglycan/xylan/chitin deacetylase (PgdA/CDA1 family)
MRNLFPLCVGAALLLTACNDSGSKNETKTAGAATEQATPSKDSSTKPGVPAGAKMASDAEIMARKQVPVLCYHHIYDIPKATREYDVTVQQFKAQMKALHDSGYKTISGEQLYNYLAYGAPLPEKPVMLTYDDTDIEQFTIAKPEMDKYGFKGVYFLMTISIGRPRYMTKEMIKQLADEGHTIGSHTWDHSRFDRYKYENEKEVGGRKKMVNDYDLQLADTKKKIEEIAGKPVQDFAFPFGIWNAEGLPELEKRGYRLAYQLSTKRDSTKPLMTVRRIIVPPQWSTEGFMRAIRTSFR